MNRFKEAVALLALCAGLANCAPRPPGVPTGASASYDWYNGHNTYTWRRTLQGGCAVWMATDNWADVHLFVGSRCAEQSEGQGVGYLSVSDFLVFKGYWPWTSDEYFHLIEFDNRGMISRIRPCPRALSPQQLSELRALAQEALSATTTSAERRMMARVNERLEATNGASLASGQEGCTDLPPDWYNGYVSHENAWVPH